jgi:uncharacterized damage-inducible protein DinB
MQETPQKYIQRMLGFVSGKEPLEVQRETAKTLARLLKPLSKKQLTRRPERGGWSIAEILAHLADSEIVVGCRMRLVIAENGVAIQPVDQDVLAEALAYAAQDSKVSLETFRVLRENNLRMLWRLPEKFWGNYGMHAERGKESVADMVRMYAGHDLNHLAQVEKIARETGNKRQHAA